MKWTTIRGFLSAALVGTVVFTTTAANAANIHSNEITDSAPSSSNPFTLGQTVAANMTASGIGRGSGLTGNAGSNRYNAAGFNTTLDLNDYFSWTLTPNSGFQIDFTNLTGNYQRSSTGPTTYAFRSSLDGYAADIATGAITGSGSAVAFSMNLGGAAFNSVTSAITFRLYAYGGTSAAGTFSVNDFIFDGSVSALATGNNSTITAPGTAGFGRVMQGQTPSLNVNLTKTGSDATTYSAVASNNGLTVTADGAIAGGSQNEIVGLQLANNANGSASTGTKAYTLTVDNTIGTSAGAGQGSADANDVVNVSATVVGNRTINSSAVNLGSVIVGASTGAQNTTLSTTGDDNNNTRVTVNGASATDGSVIVAAGSSQLFDGAADTVLRSVAGTFATAGPKSGAIGLSTAGEGLSGEAVNPVAVSYTAAAFDSSTAAFAANSANALTIDFGTFMQGSGVQSVSEAIFNALQTAGYTAELDFDSIIGSGDTSVLFTDLANGEFTALAAGLSNAYSFLTSFDTNNVPGVYSATYTLGLSDADTYAGAGLAGSQVLTLNVSGTIIPEPSTLLLVLPGLITLLARRERVVD